MESRKIKKSTRRAFGRRALAFGIAMFAMVTLTAVGFAAWLISSNATQSAGGNVKTQEVSQANITINITNTDDNGNLVLLDDSGTQYNIEFAAPAEPVAGAIITFTNDGDYSADNTESLTFAFKGNIENSGRVGELDFSIRVPDAIIAAAGLTESDGTWTYNPANAYILLPSYAMDEDGNSIPDVASYTGTIGGSAITWNTSSDPMTAKVSFKDNTNGVLTLAADSTQNSASGVTLGVDNGKITFASATSGTDMWGFGWGARYNNVNPANLFLSNQTTWAGYHGLDATDYCANDLELELIKLSVAVNGLTEGWTGTTADYAYQKVFTSIGDATIENYVHTQSATDADTVKTGLDSIQTAITSTVSSNRPQYTLYIEAYVK